MPGRGDGWGSSLWDTVQEEGGGRRVWGVAEPRSRRVLGAMATFELLF